VKVDGRKSHAELRPDVVALAKRLARRKPKGGKPFAAKSVASMLASSPPPPPAPAAKLTHAEFMAKLASNPQFRVIEPSGKGFIIGGQTPAARPPSDKV
jgi:hypothetical protein